LLPFLGPVGLFSRCVCGGVIVCRGARVQPGTRPGPGDCDGRHRCRPEPDAPQPGSSQGALTCRPRKGRPGYSRHIAWLSADPELLCDITPLIWGVLTHDNEKDHFPAWFGEYLRGGRAGNARTGPAGAAGPGSRPGPQPGRDHAGHRAALTPRGLLRNKPTGPSLGCYVPLISCGFAGSGAWGRMLRRGLEVGGAGREQRRCGLAGASARQEMTRGLAVIPVLQRSKQRINDRRAPGTTPMPHRVIRTGCGMRAEGPSGRE
jgi:hypothetical protein